MQSYREERTLELQESGIGHSDLVAANGAEDRGPPLQLTCAIHWLMTIRPRQASVADHSGVAPVWNVELFCGWRGRTILNFHRQFEIATFLGSTKK